MCGDQQHPLLFNIRSKIIFFVMAGFIALPVEFLFRFVATNNPQAFGFAIIFYPIFLIIALFFGKLILGILGKISPVLGYGLYYLLLGVFGLLVFEWGLAGNSPWGNPNANQFAMFSYWALLALIPKIFSERKNQTIINSRLLKNLIVIHLVAHFVVSLGGGLVLDEGYPRFAWIIWTFIIAFSFMNVYAIWLLLKLKIQR